MKGWIKLHRSLLEWEWYDDTNTVRLFLHLLLKANHKEKSWRGIVIKRGQLYTSLDSLSGETGLTPRQIRTSLDKLKATGEVSGTNMRRGRMITVSKYDLYQGDDSHSAGIESGKSQSSDRLATATKNDKNENNNTGTSDDARDRCPHQKIVDSYNRILIDLPAVAKLTDSRRQLIRSRWNQDVEHQSVEFWDKFFAYVSQSDFLMGRSAPRPGASKPWQASFDWIMKQANFVKIYEGNYENQVCTQ